MNPWWTDLIRRARSGDPVAGQAMLACLADYDEAGVNVPLPLREYRGRVLRNIARGRDANRELGTPSGNRLRDIAIARRVFELRQAGYPRRSSRRRQGVFEKIGAEFHLSAASIRQIYDGAKKRPGCRWLAEAEYFPTTPVKDENLMRLARRMLDTEMTVAFAHLYDALHGG